MLIGRHLTGLHTSVRAIEGNFRGWATAIGGATMMLGGLGMLGMMKDLLVKTKEFSNELVKIERLGGSMGSMVRSGEFSTKAFDVAKKSGLSVVDAMKIPGDTYSIIGAQPSMDMWQKLADYVFVQKQQGTSTGSTKDDLNKLIRSAEMTGRLTHSETSEAGQEELGKFLDMMSKINAATHGTVNADTMLNMAKQGGFTLRGLTDEGFLNMAMMAQAMGGNRAGTALLSTWGQLATGKMQKGTAQGMQDLGLLKEGEWSTGKGGHVVINDDASKRLAGLVNKDPMHLATAIKEALKAKGITDPEEQMRMIVKAMGTQTRQRFTAEEVMNYKQMESECARIQGGVGSEGAHSMFRDKSVSANIEAMKNAWDNLLNAAAGPNAQASIGVMKGVTDRLNGMTDAILKMDPGTVSGIAQGVAAFAAGLVVLGGVALATIAGIPALILATVVAIGTFIELKWGLLSWYIDLVSKGVTSLIESFTGLYAKIWEIIKAISSFTGKAFTNPGNVPPTGDPSGAAPMKFNPADIKVKANPITLALNIDGRTLAQTISQEIDYLHEHPTSAPSYDNTSRFGPADGGIISG